MADKFKNKYRIPSARATFWDYRWNAAYFVTICTQNRECCFGEIKDKKMHLSEIGRIAQNCWVEIPQHFPYAKLGNHIIMPNHMHGIVIIENPIDSITPVETLHATSLQSPTTSPSPTPTASIPKNEKMAAISPKEGSLSAVVRSYKSAVSRLARRVHADFGWQTRYHDHIIRNASSFDRISDYILCNAANWAADTFYESKL